jgi:hypothetical protein
MGFLDNSGDIILDAVLTDTGRFRLARGDGSFRIAKFAFGDDEINYALYDKTNPNGSAFYDLEIMQTPVLEAFTNNTATMNSKLLSISRKDLLFMPVLKLNGSGNSSHQESALGGFIVAVDSKSEESTADGGYGIEPGVIRGETLNGAFIRVDQGLDTTQVSADYTLAAELTEAQYIVEMDNRLGYIVSPSLGTNTQVSRADVSFIDDDNIASYFLSLNNANFVVSNTERKTEQYSPEQVIAGPRGTTITFSLGASIDLNTSDFLFDQLGSTQAAGTTGNPTGQIVKFIDTIIRITGATTGCRIDIPVRFAKVPL